MKRDCWAQWGIRIHAEFIEGGALKAFKMSSSGPTGFLGRSSSSNSNMRGLVQFIADLRNARARELEEKRINKELANIRYVCLLPSCSLSK